MREIKLVPIGFPHNLRESDARFAIDRAYCARSLLLANQRSRIGGREVNFLRDEIFAQQFRLTPPQLGQRIVVFASAPLTMADQVNAAPERASFSIIAAARRISPCTRRSKVRKRSSCV